MKKLIRPAIWLGVLAIVVALGVIAAQPKPVLVDVAEVEQGTLEVAIEEDGLTRIKERYVVSTPLAGRLSRVVLEVGDEVTANTSIIATMQANDPSLLDPRAVAQARARVSAAERRLEAARALNSKAISTLEFAKLELDRVKNLRQPIVMTKSEIESTEMEHRVRSEELKAASFRVEIAEYELELERAALLLTAPDRSQPSGEEANADGSVSSPGESHVMELTMKAPITGRILRIYQESSAVLNAGSPIMELGDPVDLEVVVDVLSSDAVKIAIGDVVWLENWGGENPLKGEVRVVEPSGFTKLSALGVEEQRVNVIIDLVDAPKDRRSLGDGFRVDARIIIWDSADAVHIPTSALFRVGSEWGVFVVDSNGKAVRTMVRVGQSNGRHAQILEGLETGESVIVHPSDAIKDGIEVELRDG